MWDENDYEFYGLAVNTNIDHIFHLKYFFFTSTTDWDHTDKLYSIKAYLLFACFRVDQSRWIHSAAVQSFKCFFVFVQIICGQMNGVVWENIVFVTNEIVVSSRNKMKLWFLYLVFFFDFHLLFKCR